MFSPERNFNDWILRGLNNVPATLFKTIESTHRLMKEKGTAGEIPLGTLFVADSQSAGRGRHQRTWSSPEGKNLYFNILIPLEGIPLSKAPQITQVAALTFAEVFQSLQEESLKKGWGDTSIGKITVKWPNDILCGKSKFCGILAEIVYTKHRHLNPSQTIIDVQNTNASLVPAISMGVGINVNSEPSEYDALNRAVTTLKAITGKFINREKLLQALVGNLERALGQFKAFGITPWVNAWKKMDKFIGCKGTIIVSNNCTDNNRTAGVQKKSGRILDMQPDGSLLFECDDGTVETVYSADLEV